MSSRNAWLDQIKGLACLFIVFHHLAFYGPMADVVRPFAPEIIDWFFDYARMAVQVFLVVGGYLSAAGLTPQGVARHTQVLPLIGKRFVRLVIPFAAALMVTIVITEVVRSLGFEHRSMSDAPDWRQLLAHLFLLHGVGGWESLSAGVWYVAIDFQLYTLTALWICISHCLSKQKFSQANTQIQRESNSNFRLQGCPFTLTQNGIVILVILSLCHWNRDSNFDNWAIYFIGAYGLGILAYWASHNTHRWCRWIWIATILVLGTCALFLEWRTRIALALLMSLVLACADAIPWPKSLRHWHWKPLQYLGQISYSVFLIHFSMSLLVNAIWQNWWPSGLFMNVIGCFVAAALSVMAGHLLYRWVEHRSANWIKLIIWQTATMLVGFIVHIKYA